MTRGFVFSTTGPGYTRLAQQAAKTVAAHHPDIPIDLFTDQDIDDATFSKIHKLNDIQTVHRPRFEAMHQNRFDQAIYLDADLFVIAPIDDIFDTLDAFDFAAAHDQRLNVTGHTLLQQKRPVPHTFPQFNAGVMGVKKSATTDAFVCDWETCFLKGSQRIDQPALREVLYYSTLRIATLPTQYNVIDCDLIRCWDSRTTAPRVLHSSEIHHLDQKGHPKIRSPQDLVGTAFYNHLLAWQATDSTLTPQRNPERIAAFVDRVPGLLLETKNLPSAGDPGGSPLRRWWRDLRIPFFD